MGTGVGEAMLIGAAVGGGSAAITGGDPLKGAMLGAAGGGLGAGFGAAAGAGGATAGTAAASTSSVIPGAIAGAEGAALSAAAPVAGGTAVGSLSPTVTGLAPASTFGGFNPALASGAAPGATLGSTTGGAAAFNPAIVSGAPAASSIGLVPTSGALGGSSGIGGASIAGYTPGMYSSGAVPMPGGVTPVSTPFSIRDLLSKAPTPDVTGSSETKKQIAQATGKNIFGYMPGESGFLSDPMLAAIGGGSAFLSKKSPTGLPAGEEDYISSFNPSKFRRSEPTYAPEGIYVPEYRDYTTAAEGGIMQAFQSGGPVERMSQMNTALNPQGGLYPQGMIDKTQYAVPTQRPTSMEVLDAGAQRTFNNGGIAEILENAQAQGLTPEAYQQIYGRGNAIVAMQKALKEGQIVNGMARGGISSLGGYSDGGRMLKGPGDGMSDSIPGVIANKQPARLADGEFVVPADVVSHLGNGSTDAGAKQLYAMMDKVRKARTGKKKQAPAVKVNRYMPV